MKLVIFSLERFAYYFLFSTGVTFVGKKNKNKKRTFKTRSFSCRITF